MKTTIDVRRVHVEKILEGSHGRFITVVFTKKDNTERTMNGRFGVRKGVKGTQKTPTAKIDNPYKVMYDAKIDDFRHINLETIKEVRMNSTIYRVVG